MQTTTAIAKREVSTPVCIEDYAMSIERVVGQVKLIQQVVGAVMKDGEHYGKIPGCGPKPTLLKPGAEKLSVTFRLVPEYKIDKTELPNAHREYEVVCLLTHAPTGTFFGTGVGSCSTMETKYRYRKAEQKCPKCGEPAVIRGKKEYGGGWLCFKNKGGCGAKFKDGDASIENQEMGRVEHDNPADYYNTVMKMAKKRAHVDAILTATAASDIFIQDVEDYTDYKDLPNAHENIPESVRDEEEKTAAASEFDTLSSAIAGPLLDQFLQATAKGNGVDIEALKARAVGNFNGFKEAFETWKVRQTVSNGKPANGNGNTQPEPQPDPWMVWRASWINLRSEGFTKFVMANLGKFEKAPEGIKKEAAEKWTKLYEHVPCPFMPFPDPIRNAPSLEGAEMAPAPCPNRGDDSIMTKEFCNTRCHDRVGCPVWPAEDGGFPIE